MKRNIQCITLLSALGLLAGCAVSRQDGKTVTVTPSPCVLTPDSANQIQMDMRFHIPRDYFSKRSRLVITPQLLVNDSVRDEYVPLVLDAPIYNKKKERMEALTGYSDPYDFQAQPVENVSRSFDLPYHESFELPEGTDGGRIVAVISTDGCGECTGIDTIEIASIEVPVPEVLALDWIEPVFVITPKVMEGKKVAHLQFTINKSDIELSFGNNRRELDDMVGTLAPILGDSLATLNSLTITGMASADGSLAYNTELSRSRAVSAKNWLINRLSIPRNIQRQIFVDSRPEGWEPVLAAMIADGNPHSDVVRNILEKYDTGNDDTQEYHIRRLSCWKEIKDNYLQKDRKVEYVYSYTLKSFTSEAELLDMYRTRPDAFNESELLRVASLVETDRQKIEVYRTIRKYFPRSRVAANNLAALYLREGDEAKALEVLDDYARLVPDETIVPKKVPATHKPVKR